MTLDDGRIAEQQAFGQAAGAFGEVGVGFQVGVTQERRAALAVADEFAGAAQLRVGARDFEAIGVLVDDLEFVVPPP